MERDIQSLDVEIKGVSLSKYGREPIYDGIVDLNTFISSKTKILWILKEVNSEDDEGDWSLRETIQNLKTEKGFKRGWGKTFSSIVYVSEGILNDSVWDDIPYEYNDPNVIDVLKNIAFINLKKVAGVSKSNPKELYEAYQNYREILIKQVDLIDADITIFGGTYLYFKNDFKSDNVKRFGSCNIFQIGDKIYIDAYHPQYIGITREIFFNDIISAIKSLKGSIS